MIYYYDVMMMSTLPCSCDDVCGLMQVQLATKSLHELVRPTPWMGWEISFVPMFFHVNIKTHKANVHTGYKTWMRDCGDLVTVFCPSSPQKEQFSSLHPSVVQVENALAGNCARTWKQNQVQYVFHFIFSPMYRWVRLYGQGFERWEAVIHTCREVNYLVRNRWDFILGLFVCYML